MSLRHCHIILDKRFPFMSIIVTNEHQTYLELNGPAHEIFELHSNVQKLP